MKPTNDLDKTLLVLNMRHVEDLTAISSPIATVASRTRTRLLVVLFHPSFEGGSGTGSWAAVHKLLTHAYVQATTVAQEQDKILMQVDVILRGLTTSMEGVPSLLDNWEKIFYLGNEFTLPIPNSWRALPSIHLRDLSDTEALATALKVTTSSTFPVVILGGTFDHLHAGHKILLSLSAWITERKIIVGVTDDALLVKKAYKELLEPLFVRINAARDFLAMFKPGLIYDIVPITDVCGPAGWDADIQALVVSKETLPGAATVASLRAQKSFPPLQTFVIDVISAVSSDLGTDDPEALKHAKMSSTFIREWIHQHAAAASERNEPRAS